MSTSARQEAGTAADAGGMEGCRESNTHDSVNSGSLTHLINLKVVQPHIELVIFMCMHASHSSSGKTLLIPVNCCGQLISL